MKAWDLPAQVPIVEVFEWCYKERQVDRLLLSARSELDKRKGLVLRRPSIEGLIAALFDERVLERKWVRKWPGSELVNAKAVVYLISFDASLIKHMAEVGERLEDWRHARQPPLPEDPCLFRDGDEWPVLVSVTHERDAWILSEERPSFCLKEPFEFDPDSLLVPPASQGFLGD